MTQTALVEHFFRHQYGKLVAKLTCRVGFNFLVDVEDAVQSALLSALELWTISGLPQNPSAWLYRVAHNNLMEELRKQNRRNKILERFAISRDVDRSAPLPQPDEFQDDILRMLFVCCDDKLPVESQLTFALKTLCGFNVREISIRLFTTQANTYKRLERTKKELIQSKSLSMDLNLKEYCHRLPSVQKVLYLLFTEGYLSCDGEVALRRELCGEAMRLANVLLSHQIGKTPETYALLSLMHFHNARTDGRENSGNDLLLLEEQDRSLWDQKEIHNGLYWLSKSAEGDLFSRYHAEAGIAAEHCLSPSFQETRWEKIVECYLLLEEETNSPIHRLNRAVAVSFWKGPVEGLKILDDFSPPSWLVGSYQWAAVMADLHQRCGNRETAQRFHDVALQSAPTIPVKELLKRRFHLINGVE